MRLPPGLVADTATVQVDVVRDWVDYAGLAGSLLAAGLAVIAIMHADNITRQARKDAAEAAEQARLDAAHDRRIQWELSVLGEMSRQHGVTGAQHLTGYVRSLIRADAPDDDLPLLRQVLGIYPNEHGQARLDAIREAHPRDTMGDYYRQLEITRQAGVEIEEAITRRLP